MASGLGNLRFNLQLGCYSNSNNNDRLFLNSTGRYHSVNGILLIPGGRRRQIPNPNFLYRLHELMKEEIDYVTPTLQGNKRRFRRDVIPRLLFRVHIVLGCNTANDHRCCNIHNVHDLQQLLNEIQIRGFVYRFVIEAYHPDLLMIPLNCSNLDSVMFAVPIRRQRQQQHQHHGGGGENHQNNNASSAVTPPTSPPPFLTTTGTSTTTTAHVPNVSPPPPTTRNDDEEEEIINTQNNNNNNNNNRNNDDNNNNSASSSSSTTPPPCCPVCSNDTCPACQRNRIKYCIICMEYPVNHVIIPCGHLSLCENCSSPQILSLMSRSRNNNINQPLCPDCRTPIERTMKVYGGRICQ